MEKNERVALIRSVNNVLNHFFNKETSTTKSFDVIAPIVDVYKKNGIPIKDYWCDHCDHIVPMVVLEDDDVLNGCPFCCGEVVPLTDSEGVEDDGDQPFIIKYTEREETVKCYKVYGKSKEDIQRKLDDGYEPDWDEEPYSDWWSSLDDVPTEIISKEEWEKGYGGNLV